ncbi:MAG: ABC transporter permease [Thermoguttaceae bacterium]|jgi:ABC-type lipoprotein export system ATPase subunit/ABC-type antimicrobial peptide transport system permease subunit
MELLRLENITKTYYLGQIDVPALGGISLSIDRGEMVALMGASGSGKTTLMNILGCLDRPTSGRYWLDGREMSGLTPNQRALVRSARIGFVFQSFNLLPRATATQNVLMPLDYAVKRLGSGDAHHRAARLLERIGLAARAEHEPSQMSGGQQQRVAIARSLVNRPALVLADEPTGNLDSHTSVEILRMFQQLNAEGITVVLVTHDANVAAYAHRTIRIADGMIEDDGRAKQRIGAYVAAPALRSHHEAATLSPAGRKLFSAGGSEGNGGHAGRVTQAAEATATTARSGHGGPPPDAPPDAKVGARVGRPGHGERVPQRGRSGPARLLPPTFRTALGALARNKMRSTLTALGVIIGVAAVITMTEIGEGSKKAMERTIGSMGANNLLIFPGAANGGGVNFGNGSVQSLKPKDVQEMVRQCPAVSDAAPMVWCHAQIVYSNRNWMPNNIVGTTPSYFVVRDWLDLEEGDFFTDRDVRDSATVCLIGVTLKHELFQDESPVGKEMRIRNVPFRVIGVLSPKGANMVGQDQDDLVVAPWTTVKFRVNGAWVGSANSAASASAANQINTLNTLYPGQTALYPVPSVFQTTDTPQPIRMVSVDWILAKAASPEQIPDALEQITGLLRERHHLPAERDEDFNIRNMAEITKMLSSASTLMSVLLLIVAAISLIVGGVGIMNIMLVSVTERTREIGLRMAVGARSHHILRQFLVEAVLLCLVGGGIGILLGRGASILIRSVQRWPTQASLPAILAAVLVSAGVGIIFGFYPAWKASRLDPIEALRYE